MTEEVTPQGEPAEPTPAPATGTEEQPPKAAEPTPGAAPEEPPAKPRGGFQRRIDRLTQEKYELAARVRELEEKSTPAAKEPKREDFESLEDYIEKRAEFRARQAASEVLRSEREQEQRQAMEAQSRQLLESWEDQKEAASARIPDFDEVLATSDAPMTAAMGRALMESEKGADIAYHLAKNPTEAARISRLSPARQAVEIGKLEAKLAAPPKPRPSAAPPPIEPVKGGDTTATDAPSDKDDVATWMRKERERMKQRAS